MFHWIVKIFCFSLLGTSLASISPIHEMKAKMKPKIVSEAYLVNSPHNVIKHLDNSILKNTKNVTLNPEMEENLFKISKLLVTAILSKLEIQDKITRITREALDASGLNKGISAIETRRILDYISRTLAGNIVTITRESTEPELHRLVYGIAQIAAEVSIISALQDNTYASSLSRKQSIDLSSRKKRSIPNESPNVLFPTPASTVRNTAPTLYSILFNETLLTKNIKSELNTNGSSQKNNPIVIPRSPYSVVSTQHARPIQVLPNKRTAPASLKGFLNQTLLEIENGDRIGNESDLIVMDKVVNNSFYVAADTLDTQEIKAPNLLDDWIDNKENIFKPALNPDLVAEMEINPDIEEDIKSEKKAKQKLERLENKAKKAMLYAGDVAYLAASSVVALRRTLTASIEVQMSVKYAKNGLSNHQDLMMNLAKTAAQQAGKEAKSATSKSIACDRVIKLALKYTAQSVGAKLNHVANRIVMDTLPLTSLAKSMAFVASDVAINSLYQATDIKQPLV